MLRARKKRFQEFRYQGSNAKQKGGRKNENEAGEREEKEKRGGGGGGGEREREGFIAALPSSLNHVKAWPEANFHIKIL